jgi:selenocysteine-specific elongation factor
MIVGTAGHIDHGKTTLVRALTGVDTDRLPEEKRRGISIELGYAFLPTPDGPPIGLVDVPGHERLVHTMLAGATGIDAVLLLVAADDGVMPQTREHLAIASLLGIRSGAVVVTKCDRASPARIEEVGRQIADLVAGTALAQAPLFVTAAPSGDGVESLRQWLIDQAARARAPSGSEDAFRLAVDRVFTLDGVGTVVTGSVFSGKVAIGDLVQIVPTQRQARVRSIHAQSRPCETAGTGQRCALNLAATDRHEIQRGQWICDPRAALATDRLDARVTVWHGQSQALRSGAQVHLHVGAVDALARVALLRSDFLAPGASGHVQVILRQKVGAWHGDRIVLRDAAAAHTIAGGRVLDPCAPTRYSRTPQRLAHLAALESDEVRQRLEAVLEVAPFGVSLRSLQRAWALKQIDPIVPHTATRIAQGDADWAVAPSHWGAVRQAVLNGLTQLHEREPDSIGVEAGRLRRIALPRADDAIVHQAIDSLVTAGQVMRQGPFLQLAAHAVRQSEQELRLAQRILPLLEAADSDPPWVRDIARDLKLSEAAVRTTLAHLAQRGEVFQVVKDLYLHRCAVEKLARTARELAQRDGSVRAAPFRDATGLGRKRAIQVLEFFDRVGMLRRVRDAHLVRAGTRVFLGQTARP